MSSINSIYLIFFMTGITVGFGHCIGMCGPIVISLSLQLKGRPSFWPQLLYNTGRTCTYGILGALVGGMASFTRFAEHVGGLQKGIMVATGIMIMVMGLAMTGWISTSVIFRAAPPVGTFITRVYKQLLPKKKSALHVSTSWTGSWAASLRTCIHCAACGRSYRYGGWKHPEWHVRRHGAYDLFWPWHDTSAISRVPTHGNALAALSG
jgi:sulfite exporter TauE/SafE